MCFRCCLYPYDDWRPTAPLSRYTYSLRIRRVCYSKARAHFYTHTHTGRVLPHSHHVPHDVPPTNQPTNPFSQWLQAGNGIRRLGSLLFRLKSQRRGQVLGNERLFPLCCSRRRPLQTTVSAHWMNKNPGCCWPRYVSRRFGNNWHYYVMKSNGWGSAFKNSIRLTRV
jgi:hypothetical protein